MAEWLSNEKSIERGIDQYTLRFTHTGIDDLESFLWVLLWIVLYRSRIQLGPLVDPVDGWWKTLNSQDIMGQISKQLIIRELEEQLEMGQRLGVICLFAPLLTLWDKTARRGRLTVQRMLDNGELTLGFQKPYYKEYLEAGFSLLEKLPHSWEESDTGS